MTGAFGLGDSGTDRAQKHAGETTTAVASDDHLVVRRENSVAQRGTDIGHYAFQQCLAE